MPKDFLSSADHQIQTSLLPRMLMILLGSQRSKVYWLYRLQTIISRGQMNSRHPKGAKTDPNRIHQFSKLQGKGTVAISKTEGKILRHLITRNSTRSTCVAFFILKPVGSDPLFQLVICHQLTDGSTLLIQALAFSIGSTI